MEVCHQAEESWGRSELVFHSLKSLLCHDSNFFVCVGEGEGEVIIFSVMRLAFVLVMLFSYRIPVLHRLVT